MADPALSVQDLAIRSGVIAGFDTGIEASTALRTSITSMRLINNRAGANLGSQSTVKDSIFSGTGRADLSQQTGLVAGPYSLVTGNTANDNGNRIASFVVYGVGIRVGDSSTVTGNIVYRNGSQELGQGILAGQGCTIIGNTATDNTDGIAVDTGSTVINNTSLRNRFWGVSIACPGNIIGNTLLFNFLNLHLTGTGCNVNNNVAP